MLAPVMTAALQHVQETLDIGVDIVMGMVDRMPHPRLRGKMHHLGKAVLGEQGLHRRAIGEFELDEAESGLSLEDGKPGLLQLWIVVMVEVIDADDGASASQQTLSDVKPDEAGSSSHENHVIRHCEPSQSRHSSMPAGFEQRSSL